MSREKDLVKNTFIVAIGRIVTKIWVFLLLPFYTAVLSTKEYGTVELLNTYVALLLPIATFQISDALFRYMIDARQNEKREKAVISTIVLFSVAQMIGFSILYGIVLYFVSIPYAGYLYINVIANMASAMLLQLCRGMGDNTSYAVASFLTAASAAVLNILLVLVMRRGVGGMMMSTFWSQIIGCVYVLWKEKVFSQMSIKAFDTKLLKSMLGYSLPLIPNSLCWWILGASDKSVVTYFLGVGQSGILSVSQKFSTAYTTVYNVFNLTWTENASMHKDDQDAERYYSDIIETAFRLLSGACLGMIAVMALIFPFLIDKKFDASYYQIPVYLLSALVHSVIGIFSVVYIALKKTKGIALTSVISAVINFVVNVGLIGKIGLYAASVSSVVAYLILLMIRYFDIQRYMKVGIKKMTVCSAIAVMILDFVLYYSRNMVLGILNFIIVAVYAVFMNRKIVVSFLNEMKIKLKNR